MQTIPKLRVARPTDNINSLLKFYCEGLGLRVLYHFEDHQGFDGVMLGTEGAPYHFEFTRSVGHTAGRAPSEDHLLVFYHPDRQAWQCAVDQLRKCGFDPVPAFNPYWDRQGLTFEDPDGYRVVLQNAAWTV
jgi:catechol 2,3-dioxygenase-like lactoylglutathione lyase family enzyme